MENHCHVETVCNIAAASAGHLFGGFSFFTSSVYRLLRGAYFKHNFGHVLIDPWQKLLDAVDHELTVLIVVLFFVGKFQLDWSFSLLYRLKRRAPSLNLWDDTHGANVCECIWRHQRELF